MRRAVLTRMSIILVLALLPVSAAASELGTLHLSTSDVGHFKGHIEIVAPGGAAFASDPEATGVVEVHGATGVLELSSHDETFADLMVATTRVPNPSESTFVDTKGADLRLTLAHEFWATEVVAASDGRVLAAQDLDHDGRPFVLPYDIKSVGAEEAGVSNPLYPSPPHVTWAWHAGDLFSGRFDSPPTTGFPTVDPVTVLADGRVEVQLFGGNLTYVDAQGVPHVTRLGRWSDDAAGAPRFHVASAIFRGVVDHASFPTGPVWGISGPHVEWRFDGAARWTKATGSYSSGGITRTFSDASVDALGRSVLQLATDAVAGDEYRGDGEWTSMAIGGTRVGDPARVVFTTTQAVVTVGASALLLGAVFLFTRLARADIVSHPLRARILDTVRSEPGVHLRELHRRVGGAWGTYLFHIGLLEQRGFLAVKREGRYVELRPAGDSSPALPPHAVTRRVLDALPEGGDPVTLKDLRSRVGLSRQLLDYHIRILQARDLVREVPQGTRRAVARNVSSHLSQ